MLLGRHLYTRETYIEVVSVGKGHEAGIVVEMSRCLQAGETLRIQCCFGKRKLAEGLAEKATFLNAAPSATVSAVGSSP